MAAVFFFIRVNQTRLRGETLHPIKIQVQLPRQVGVFIYFLIPKMRHLHVVLCSPSVCQQKTDPSLHLPAYFLFMSQEMEACRRLPTTPPQVHLGTLHLEAWGGPTAGHRETEHLKWLLQGPRQRRNHQLPLATAGTLDVPKDETGALFFFFFCPLQSSPLHSQRCVFELNLVTFASGQPAQLLRVAQQTAPTWWRSTWCTRWLNMLRVHQPLKPTLSVSLQMTSPGPVSPSHQHSPPSLLFCLFSLNFTPYLNTWCTFFS